jgi:hypothetical protein
MRMSCTCAESQPCKCLSTRKACLSIHASLRLACDSLWLWRIWLIGLDFTVGGTIARPMPMFSRRISRRVSSYLATRGSCCCRADRWETTPRAGMYAEGQYDDSACHSPLLSFQGFARTPSESHLPRLHSHSTRRRCIKAK